LAAPAAAREDGFVPLFNGKDLSGWVNVNCAPNTFAARDGLIVCTGFPTGVIRTAKQYENFILELEWMHVKPKGNAGLFVWSDPLTAPGTPFTRSIEVQILDGQETKDYTSHGDIFSIWGAKLKPDRPHPSGWERCLPSERRSKPAGQWNHYRVECKNGTIKLAVNGKEVSGVSECKPHRKGYLALESEGAECHFRNIKIKELPSTNPKPEEVAKADEGHKLLFNGLDLDGWKTETGSWQAAGGHLKATGTSDLVSEKSFTKFELLFDCKMPATSKAEWSVEVGKNQVFAMKNLDVDTRGRWTRVVLKVGPDEVSRTVNGRWVGSVKTGVDAGSVTFKPAAGLELMNVFVRELK
jgi:hypothetical protein